VRRRAIARSKFFAAFPACLQALAGFFLWSVHGLTLADPPQPSPFAPPPIDEWKEDTIAIPEYPHDRNLVAVPMAPGDTLKLYVDRISLKRGQDGVWRATLVLESAAGARSAYYDGLRCETREYKTYAVGPVGGRLEPLKQPSWQPIPNLSLNAFRWRLLQYYACDGNATARTPRDFLENLNKPIER
jgi:hypothetical protein